LKIFRLESSLPFNSHRSMTLSLADRNYWIFDMDGTLTIAAHDFAAIRSALDLPADQPILESIAQLPAAEAAPRRRQLAQIEREIAHQAQAQPGAIALLQMLRSQDKQIGILTRNGKDIAHTTLAACGLLSFFAPELILSRDCCAPKPKPDGIHQLLNHWQALPDQGVMVGDYVFDLLAGRNAGTATVHVDVTGAFEWPEHTDRGVTSLAELMALV
jgi:HAD superfamily hydrolase (TIGR01509 family)